jgi:hypothetical protein
MKVTKPTYSPASISLSAFGSAMSQLDLSSIPPNKRSSAVFDHLMLIMQDTLHDRSLAQEIRISHKLKHNSPDAIYNKEKEAQKKKKDNHP